MSPTKSELIHTTGANKAPWKSPTSTTLTWLLSCTKVQAVHRSEDYITATTAE